MMRVLICGPQSTSGGVAHHTQNLIKELEILKVNVIWFKIFGTDPEKMYRRTLGFFLNGVANRHRYDIIHVQFSAGKASILEAVTGTILSILTKKKLVITYHNSDIPRTPIFSLILKHSKAIVLVSLLQQRIITDNYSDYSSKTVVLSNGYDSAVFFPKDRQQCREQLQLPDAPMLIVTVGNLLNVKGHRYLIEAMDIVHRRGDDVLCAIIGGGPLAKPLSTLIANCGLKNAVILAGEKEHTEISLWLNAADLFVLPSLNEGNPTVMFEALGCGKPFVGSRVGGIPEVIISEEYGLLTEPGNSADLAEMIITGLSREWNRTAILNHAEQYSWENIAKKMNEVYTSVLVTPA